MELFKICTDFNGNMMGPYKILSHSWLNYLQESNETQKFVVHLEQMQWR